MRHFVVNAGGDRNVALDPRSMWNHWELDWREEVGAEATSFGIVPSEGFVVFANEVIQ
ncbi:hypothetical protein NEOLEDRAFT_1177429 [Neolentinus lepideus HHB14362 ss-1]|uniref:Uncharacterized protein n=1 Tax=Neolentinus lepideus HHB14362 ss-1 TaxID=1314782 RepID=A0A165TLL6_9AGAM|nr:hypothetical protein NEOLEDRAFT_1177429 [Neolentinus lepideus HHB14362 ss-1]